MLETWTSADETSNHDTVALTIETSTSQPATQSTTQPTLSGISEDEHAKSIPITYSQRASEEVDGPVALPARIAPPQPEDEGRILSGDTGAGRPGESSKACQGRSSAARERAK